MRDLRGRPDAPGAQPARPPDGRRLQLDELTIQVKESSRRRTVELTIEREGTLSLRVPSGTPDAPLLQFLEARRAWLYRHLAEKEERYRPTRQREYVSGEGFWYLGRTYRLKVLENQQGKPPLSLRSGHFELQREHQFQGRELFVRWYGEQLRSWLQEQLLILGPRIRVQPEGLQVQDLGFNWGSCSKRRELYFHWRLALVPRRIAEYVLLHELTHLEHHDHSAEFWSRLETFLPDYQDRKQWLASHGADYDL